MIFVLVPIKLRVPPRIAAKLKGIIIFDGDRLCLRAHCCSWGMKIATTGVLLITELIIAVGRIILGISNDACLLVPSDFITHHFIAPVSFTAADTI